MSSLDRFSAIVTVILIAISGVLGTHTEAQAIDKPGPTAPVDAVVDNYYGTNIVDPYRYLEDLDNPRVKAWMKNQNDYARGVIASLPGRQKLLTRLVELDQSAPFQIPTILRLPNEMYLYTKRLGSENVTKLYMRTGLKGPEMLLVDPEKIMLAWANKKKGERIIAGYAPSDDGRYVVVGITSGGAMADTELRVIETGSGRDTGEAIFGGVGVEAWLPNWLPDNHSFIYGRLQKLPANAPESEVRQKYRAYLHVLGTNAKDDRAVFGYGVDPSINVDPRLIASVRTTPGSRYAIGILNGSVTPNSAFYITSAKTAGKSNPEWRKVADLSDGVTNIAIHGDDLYLLTYQDAPHYKVVCTNALKPDLKSAETIIPPSEAIIKSIKAAQDALYVEVMDGGLGRLLRVPYGPKPPVHRVALPFEASSVGAFGIDLRLPGTLLDMSSWTKDAAQIYALDPQSGQITDTHLQPPGPNDAPPNLESVEVKVPSYDGTLIPLSIAYSKTLKRDGTNPTLMSGYGAYGNSLTPNFDPFTLAWFENGGVRAFCHTRGGGEYGEEWHLAGKGPTKPNTWRDFIACAEYLIKTKYTSPARLAAQGQSAGGILVGRAITERPDLFGAAIIDVGLLDTLRFEKSANGATNIPELGSTTTPAGFKALYAMSAYHHVTDQTAYPATLLTTGINDPLVDPWQSAKMAARLQAATSSGRPVLLQVNYEGGHGASTTKEYQEMLADNFSFLLWQFDAPEFQPRR